MNKNQPQDEILTTREWEVLKLIAHDCKNREIAETLGLEERTVRFHVANILHKLQLKNRSEAKCYACQKGWIAD